MLNRGQSYHWFPSIPGETPLFDLVGMCCAEQGMVYRVLALEKCIILYYLASWLNKESFWTRSLFKSVNASDKESTICTNNFFQNTNFHGVENYLILFAKGNESGSQNKVFCPQQASEMDDFCLELQGLDCTSLPKLSLSVPPGFQLGVYFLAAAVLHGILL